MGSAYAKNSSASLYGILKLLEFLFFGLYTARNIKNIKQLGTIAFLLSAGILFESSLAIVQYLNHGSLKGIFYFFGERNFNAQTFGIANALINGELILRPYGTFSHPNVLAGYLVIGMTTIVSNLKSQISNLKKFITFGLLFVGSVSLFLSMSRVAIILWILLLIIFSLSKLKNNFKISKFVSIFFAIIFLFILTSIIFSPLRYRFFNLSLQDETIIQREDLIRNSFQLIQSHPFFGVGINNFLTNLAIVDKPVNHVSLNYLQPVHNIYLLVLSETGIIGLMFFLIFICSTINNIIKNIKTNKKNKTFFQTNLLLLFLVLTIGFFDHYFLTIQQGQLMLSFVFGLCWANFISPHL